VNLKQIIKEALILEVGGIENHYSWTGPFEQGWHDDIGYKFQDKSGANYLVKFTRFPDDVWEREYTADGKYDETGTGDVYKVLSTITKITIDFINEFNPILIRIPHINTQKEVSATFKALKTSSATEIIDRIKNSTNKRARLNSIYLKGNLPQGYTYQLKGSDSIIKRNG